MAACTARTASSEPSVATRIFAGKTLISASSSAAMAIALFYSIATAIGGISGPVLFGNIIGTGNAASLFVAYLVGAGFMIFAAVVELILGVRAEGKSLENIATPLTAIEEATGTSAASSAT